MGDRTGIEWTDATWNPVTGCTEVSPGCDHCYAKTFAERWRGVPGHHFEQGFDLTLRPERLDQPLRWRKPRRVFVNSMSDLFHADVPDEFIAKVFATMAAAPQHTFQVLTKRHARMRSLVSRVAFSHQVLEWGRATMRARDPRPRAIEQAWPLPNVWLGVSVEDQLWADIRIPALLATPAAVRFLSCEPLLGHLDLKDHLFPTPCSSGCGCRLPSDPDSRECGCDGDCCMHPDWPFDSGIHWVIVGGESGHGARPMHPWWVDDLKHQCTSWGVPFLFKQWGQFRPAREGDRIVVAVDHCGRVDGSDHAKPMASVGKAAAGRELDGRTWDEYPAVVS